MNELLEIMKNRRSVRKYTGECIPQEKLDDILKAGLLSPSGKNTRPWEFIVVRNRSMLEELSKCRPMGSAILAGADAAIVVLGNTDATDTTTEDCSIAMAYMHLMADYLGVGSCWIQIRMRPSPADGVSAEAVVKRLLSIPDNLEPLAFLCLGIPDKHPVPKDESSLLIERIHSEHL